MTASQRMFGPERANKYAKEKPTTPSGVMFEWNGPTFNIMPLLYGELLDTIEMVNEGIALVPGLLGIQDFSNGINEQHADAITRIVAYLLTRFPGLVFTFRDHLAKSPGVCDAGTPEDRAADRERFEKWFREQDAVAMLCAFVPKMQEVFGNAPLFQKIREMRQKVLATVEAQKGSPSR